MTVQGELPERTDSPEEQAIAWFARQRSGEMTSAEHESFRRWLVESERHRAAFAEVSGLWSSLERLRADPAVLAMREQALESAPKRLSRLRAVAAVAGIAIGVLATLLVARIGWFDRTGVERVAEHRTSVGQRSTFTLSDGTTVILDADSSLQERFTQAERRVELTRGRAFFDVAKDVQRPFSVVAGEHVVQALGTAFDVEIKTTATEVTLVRGRVRVHEVNASRSEHPAVEMSAGHRLLAAKDQRWILQQADTRTSMRWVEGQLVFDQEPLADIVAVLNRYSPRKIVIADPLVAQRALSAVLAAGDIDTFLRSARALRLAEVRERADGSIELSAAPTTGSPARE
jgi:transmembrane sensor